MKLNLSRIDSPSGELLPATEQRTQLCAFDFASLSSPIHPASRLHRSSPENSTDTNWPNRSRP